MQYFSISVTVVSSTELVFKLLVEFDESGDLSSGESPACLSVDLQTSVLLMCFSLTLMKSVCLSSVLRRSGRRIRPSILSSIDSKAGPGF